MEDLSVYHRVCCAYVRAPNGQLISCTGPLSPSFQAHWADLLPFITSPSLRQSVVFPGTVIAEKSLYPGAPSVTKALLKVESVHQDKLAVYERSEEIDTGIVSGLVLRQPHSVGVELFDDVFAYLLLQDIKLFTSAPQDQGQDSDSELKETTEKIVDLFDEWLRYASDNDKWHIQGREYFFGRVYEFVRRQARLEFCLPAFPCKSSNPDKVFGVMPDRGEQLALEHLHAFLEAVGDVYKPGAKLWIVSDGHVFSDCIGVDDQTVDQYNAQLLKMSSAVSQRHRAKDWIGFKSLVDMFDLRHCATEMQNCLGLPAMDSHIATQRTTAAELSRQMLVHSCGTDPAALRARIKAADHSALKLYRGFSRFMVEDLSRNRYTSHLSRAKLKQLASKVAFEMIQRNDAYSNLVELFFPHHVRLSIHAHDNSGPKFGIRMFSPNVRALDNLSLASGEMRSVDLLHVPTPWHNCIATVSGQPTIVMTKSKVVRDALAEGEFNGDWADEGHGGKAGHFLLHPPQKVLYDVAQDHQDILDCCNPTNPYMWDLESTLDADMWYFRAVAGVGVF
ncbi:Pyoverdine/dityrosine biosynthesis protein [Madurella fahalii]|uniref:Pyoverdine/dityrosine biosynthesis protein n=1 Tax=Madurella fahalii TaxID=1157608 RepID=A0ABQ0GH43_9PEZI